MQANAFLRKRVLALVVAGATILAGCGSSGWGQSPAVEAARRLFIASCAKEHRLSRCECYMAKLEGEVSYAGLVALEAVMFERDGLPQAANIQRWREEALASPHGRELEELEELTHRAAAGC